LPASGINCVFPGRGGTLPWFVLLHTISPGESVA
jgi:hypothetical protein